MAIQSLRTPKAPSLLIAPDEYQQRYADQLNNALRLYFNQIDNGLGSLFAVSGGGGLDTPGGGALSFPFIAASDSTDQLATATDTPTVIEWDTLEGGNGFTLNAPGSATALISGIYKITFSLQFANTDNTAHTAAVWLKINNNNVPRSSTLFSIPPRKSASIFGYVCGYSEVVFALDAGDVLELYWATDEAYSVSPANDGVYIEALAEQTSPYIRPANPSALGSITFVSRLPTLP